MPSAVEAPKANPEKALAIIGAAYDGTVVVPEFQRSFVWERGDVEELLMSVLQGYFIGTFLLLDTPTDSPMFPYRGVEGLEKVNERAQPRNHQTVRLVLDGQQRITSLFYAFYAPDIPLKGARNPHKFYLRLETALEGDIEKAVEGISTYDRRRFAEMERLVEADRVLPFTTLSDSSAFLPWLYRRQQVWDDTSQKALNALHERLTQFMVPIIALSADAGKDNIINIFERINRTGVGLSLFDLAGARLYMKDIRLRDLWDDFEKMH